MFLKNKKYYYVPVGFFIALAFQNCNSNSFKTESNRIENQSQGTDTVLQSIFSSMNPTQDIVITKNIFGSELKITSQSRYSGAISSFIFRGKEYIDSADHGRELQSAMSFDLLGECYNPTEAGARDDHFHPQSHSSLLAASKNENSFSTKTDAAFWLYPKTPYNQPCTPGSKYNAAVNESYVDNYLIGKVVTLGFQNIQNVLDYEVSFTLPRKHEDAQFEILTGYMTAAFSKIEAFHLDDANVLTESWQPMGEQNHPLIVSTQDNQHSMAIYSAPISYSGFYPPTYGKFDFSDQGTFKWNTVTRSGVHYSTSAVQKGTYIYKVYVIFGTREETISSLKKVICKVPPQSGLPAFCSPQTQQITVDSNTNPNPNNEIAIPQNTVPLFRFRGEGEYFLTANKFEGDQVESFTYEGIGFYLFTQLTNSRHPLFRCFLPNQGHFTSIDLNCEGATNEGIYGYLENSSAANRVPLYRFRHPTQPFTLTTRNPDEATSNNYVFDQILGYTSE